tara:strand:- start:515 stop:745 length:231 start_codon:yes stop_codon:yes gene_type:complete
MLSAKLTGPETINFAFSRARVIDWINKISLLGVSTQSHRYHTVLVNDRNINCSKHDSIGFCSQSWAANQRQNNDKW